MQFVLNEKNEGIEQISKEPSNEKGQKNPA
jgi:hypothetical protein